MITDKSYEAVVIGVSTGGLRALETIMPLLLPKYSLAVLVVQHRSKTSGEFLYNFLDGLCALNVLEAEEKTAVTAGNIYFAPAGYHLQVEMDKSLSLSVDPPVNFSRPSVDVLFETAAEAYGDKLVGVVLTGANADGAKGLARIQELGGVTIIQDPAGAEAAQMPEAAIAAVGGDFVLPLNEIGKLLATFDGK